MSEESGTDLITSFANPNYSHVSSLLVGSNICFKETNLDEDYEEENSLLLLKSDDDCEDDDYEGGTGANALSALADAIHSLELLTKGQQDQQQQSRLAKDREYPGFSERLDRSSGCSNDSAFSSPSSESSPPLPRSRRNEGEKIVVKTNDEAGGEASEKDSKVLVGQDSLQDSQSDNTLKEAGGTCDSLASNEQEGSESRVIVDLLADEDEDICNEDITGNERNAVPNKQESAVCTSEESHLNLGVLSPGWERCEDASGPYYWHIKTGTIQRHPPDNIQPSTSMEFRTKLTEPDVVAETKSSLVVDAPGNIASVAEKVQQPQIPLESATTTSKSSVSPQSSQCRPSSSVQPSPFHVGGERPELPVRFAVRSLGWVAVNEEDLTRERSSQTVNRCIVDLSLGGKKDINDSIGKWGDGKYLYMDIDQMNLSLIDPIDLTVLNTQAIKSLRVWGVGRENARDFAYVAKDRITRAFACHVFRCDQPARHIAATLCHVCKMAVAKRDTLHASGLSYSSSSSSSAVGGVTPVNGTRPNRLLNLDGKTGEVLAKYEDLLKNSSFPTPMDEPKKVINCHYLGTIQVSMPTGVEVLNGAIDTLNVRIPPEKWKYVDVTVAPSTITIAEHEFPDNVLAECRVRFLSFLGISLSRTKLCAFIMHTAQDNFMAHVFYCEPSAGPLCKTIEAACKLRFQKCLDRKGLTPQADDRGLRRQQAGNQTIKLDIAGEVDEEDIKGKIFDFSLPSLPAHEILQKAKTGLNKSATTIRGGLVRASSLVSESADNIKQSVSSLNVKDNLTSSAIVVKGLLSSGVKVTKNGFSSTVEYLKKKKQSLILPLGIAGQPSECHQPFHQEKEAVEKLITDSLECSDVRSTDGSLQ